MLHLSRYLLALALSTASIVATACSQQPEAADSAVVKPVEARRAAPDFELKDPDGRTVRLSDYRGKVVLLNFWATWCGPCRIEIPWFIEFERNLKHKGFAVIGVSLDEGGWDVVKPYLRQIGVNYRVLLGDDRVATLYGGVDSLPTTFLIDREGRIAAVHVGLVSKKVYREGIDALLGDSASVQSSGVSEVSERITGSLTQ